MFAKWTRMIQFDIEGTQASRWNDKIFKKYQGAVKKRQLIPSPVNFFLGNPYNL